MYTNRAIRTIVILMLICTSGVVHAGAKQGTLYSLEYDLRIAVIDALAHLGYVKQEASMREHERGLYRYIVERRRFTRNFTQIPKYRHVDLGVCLLFYRDRLLAPSLVTKVSFELCNSVIVLP